jgi:hypothetical protein
MFTVDASDVHEMTKRAEVEFGNLGKRMLRAAKHSAKYERDTHPYTNRTFRLQRSTDAGMMGGWEEISVVLYMGMYYASFVNNLGYSHIENAAQQCQGWIWRDIITMPRRIGI